MTTGTDNDRLGRLAQLAAAADEAVRETVGQPIDNAPTGAVEQIEDRSEQHVQHLIEGSTPPAPKEDRDATANHDAADRIDSEDDDHLVTMALGLDVGLEPDPPPVRIPEAPSARATAVSSESAQHAPKPSTIPFTTFVGAAVVLLALVGLLVITQVPGSSQDEVASPDATERVQDDRSAPLEDAGATNTLERATATQVSRTNSEPQEVDLVATVGEVTNESMPDTAWELVGSEPGTAMIAEVVDPAWLQSTFEQTLDDDGEPVAFTFFAPSDSALASLADAQLETFATNDDRAKDFIDSHIVDVRLTEDDLRAQVGSSLITRSGLSIEVALDGDQLVLNGQPALFPSLVAANGTLIVIDDVLHMPDANDAG